ncbi:acyltransferase, partial [Yersinia enterocolitica]|nr:acyltransferase [Yersinia enterocolitica]
ILSGGLLAWVTINKKHLILKLNSSEKILSLKINTHKSIFTKITDNTYSIIGIVLLFIGFVFINESVKFPGFYAAIPVVGAILLILAGPNAWFNKMVLSNRIIVWFGLISFPLYLWHWPLLSFAHIMESGTPSVAIRLLLVVLSIFMAWVSLHFIENKIRKGSFFKVKTIFLLVVMACLGACGYVVTSNNGFPSRVQSLSEHDSAVLSQMETPRELSNDSCRKVFPKISDYICITKSAGIPETILFGDSHALHFYHGLSVIDNKNVGVLGGGWTSAGLNPIINSINKDNKLNVIQKDIYDYIGSNPAIKNVVISCASIVCHKNKINFDANLRKTFDYFLSKKKNITFILDIPNMPFDSKKCLNERPFNFRADASESCLTAKSYFDNSNKKYRDDVFKVLKDYPEVRYFDPSKYICDEKYCYAFIDNKFLYMTTGDNSHLSNNGSELLANPLYKKINSIN